MRGSYGRRAGANRACGPRVRRPYAPVRRRRSHRACRRPVPRIGARAEAARAGRSLVRPEEFPGVPAEGPGPSLPLVRRVAGAARGRGLERAARGGRSVPLGGSACGSEPLGAGRATARSSRSGGIWRVRAAFRFGAGAGVLGFPSARRRGGRGAAVVRCAHSTWCPNRHPPRRASVRQTGRSSALPEGLLAGPAPRGTPPAAHATGCAPCSVRSVGAVAVRGTAWVRMCAWWGTFPKRRPAS